MASKSDFRRIAAATRAFENDPRRAVQRAKHHAPVPVTGFWAELGAHGEDGKYSWKRIGWNPDNETFEDDEDLGEGFNDKENYAIELDKEEKFPVGLRVWLTPVLSQDFLCFQSTDTFEGRGSAATTSSPTVSVELKFKSSYTGKIVEARNRGERRVIQAGWCEVMYRKGEWILWDSGC